MTTDVRITCIACGARLKPGYDFPYEPATEIYNVVFDGKHPIVCRDPVECLKRTNHLPSDSSKGGK
jgi:hypothetical protein